MFRIVLLALGLAACSPALHTVKLVNQTDRRIEEIYVFSPGATKHGASRGSLAPKASTQLQLAAGNVEVLAVSAKVRVDARSTDTRTASQVVELRGPVELVFVDSNQPPPPDRPGTIGVTFRVMEAPPTPSAAPADDASPSDP